MMRLVNQVLLVALFAIGALACGESDCEKFGSLVCDKACSCTDGSGCQITQGGATISFDSKSDCEFFYVDFGCDDSAGDLDYAACTDLLENAACADVGDGTMGVQWPDDPVCEYAE